LAKPYDVVGEMKRVETASEQQPAFVVSFWWIDDTRDYEIIDQELVDRLFIIRSES
jgi:hypothetical protein